MLGSSDVTDTFRSSGVIDVFGFSDVTDMLSSSGLPGILGS